MHIHVRSGSIVNLAQSKQTSLSKRIKLQLQKVEPKMKMSPSGTLLVVLITSFAVAFVYGAPVLPNSHGIGDVALQQFMEETMALTAELIDELEGKVKVGKDVPHQNSSLEKSSYNDQARAVLQHHLDNIYQITAEYLPKITNLDDKQEIIREFDEYVKKLTKEIEDNTNEFEAAIRSAIEMAGPYTAKEFIYLVGRVIQMYADFQNKISKLEGDDAADDNGSNEDMSTTIDEKNKIPEEDGQDDFDEIFFSTPICVFVVIPTLIILASYACKKRFGEGKLENY